MEARRDAFGQAIGLTQKYAPLAVGTLVKLMNDPSDSNDVVQEVFLKVFRNVGSFRCQSQFLQSN